jgi:uncharacterized protein YndB with AHSA1/START domain
VPLALESRLPIANDPTKVWGLLVEPRSWKTWWPAVRDARSKDFKPLREGSSFEVTLQMGRITVTLRPKVALCADNKALTWDGLFWGVPLHQEWFLEPRPDGCRMVARSRFNGPGATVLSLLRIGRVWERMLTEQVRGLKKVGEQL